MKYTTFKYNQTYCSDPWPTGVNDSLTLKNVAHYLDSLQLYIASMQLKPEMVADSCSACNCKTGNTIYVTTFDTQKDKEIYNAIGFR